MKNMLKSKLEELKAHQPKEEEELETAKELSALMKDQQNMESATSSLKEIGGCRQMLERPTSRMEEVGSRIRGKTKRPVEERMRSLQEKKAYRVELQKKLERQAAAAEEA